MTHDHGLRCRYGGIGLAFWPSASPTAHGYDTSRSFLEELG